MFWNRHIIKTNSYPVHAIMFPENHRQSAYSSVLNLCKMYPDTLYYQIFFQFVMEPRYEFF